jgi:hypothetical protein
MTKYTETDDFIVRDNENESISYIPKDENNSDYQAYLKSLQPKAKAAKVVNAPVSE